MFEITRSAITVFGFDVHFYGLLIALGVLLAVLLASRREKQMGLPGDTALNIALICIPAALICARLYYVAFSWEYYAANPKEILNVRAGGMAVYGGILGGILAGFIYCRVKRIAFAKGLDLAAPSIALGQAIGRWGNFLNMEAYGAQVLNPSLQFFPVAVPVNGAWHYAAFFYESAWCLLIVLLVLAAEKKGFFEKSGDIFLSYIFLYGIERAVVEGLRTDSLMLGPVRVSQALSLLLVLAAVLALLFRRKKLPLVLRILPAFEAILLGVSLSLQSVTLTAISALVLVAHTAAIYKVRT